MMNCKQAKPLIPLFVEADLNADEMQQVTNHVTTCAACSELAADFRASQLSLHALAAPEFDEALLAAMRTAVQREIARPTFADWLTARWPWKLAYVTAAVCLLFGIVVWHRQPTAPNERRSVAQHEKHEDKTAAPLATNTEAKRVGILRAAASHRPARQSSPTPKVRVSEPLPTTIETATAFPAETATTPTEPEMLRMEFQTADPNIRIIWFTPKEPERTNPATDTK